MKRAPPNVWSLSLRQRANARETAVVAAACVILRKRTLLELATSASAHPELFQRKKNLGKKKYILRKTKSRRDSLERPRASDLVQAVDTACQLVAWWSVENLDSVTRALIDGSA